MFHAVTKLFPVMAKSPTEPFVSEKVQFTLFPEASCAVSTPTSVPEIALLFTVELLMLTVIGYPQHLHFTIPVC